MPEGIQFGDIEVQVQRKDIKNLHLSVYPPEGAVRVSAPSHMSLDTIRVFTLSKLDWIKREQRKMREQERETPREYRERESHYLWGKRYLLSVSEKQAPPTVAIDHTRILLTVRPGTDEAKRQKVIDEWYRGALKEAIPPLIAKWEPLMNVSVNDFTVRRMKTRWGSCNPIKRTILINLELAKKPTDCLEYIVVHEMVHLLEPTHNGRFVAFMNQFLPNWRQRRDELNRLPVRHQKWKY